MEIFIPSGTFESPNGIAISNDGRKLFISDLPFGVYVVDLKTKRSERLPQSVGISPSGSDGLYFYDNSLIGIINIVSERNGRVARFYLDGSANAVTQPRCLIATILSTNGPRRAWLSEIHSSTSQTVNLAASIVSNERFHKNIYARLQL